MTSGALCSRGRSRLCSATSQNDSRGVLSKGTLTSHFADGTSRDFDYEPGTTSSYKAPVEHNAVNTGKTDIVGYEIEFKS